MAVSSPPVPGVIRIMPRDLCASDRQGHWLHSNYRWKHVAQFRSCQLESSSASPCKSISLSSEVCLHQHLLELMVFCHLRSVRKNDFLKNIGRPTKRPQLFHTVVLNYLPLLSRRGVAWFDDFCFGNFSHRLVFVCMWYVKQQVHMQMAIVQRVTYCNWCVNAKVSCCIDEFESTQISGRDSVRALITNSAHAI